MVGYNIRRFREAKGLTQEQLAERLNVTRQAVSNWETEKTQPDIDTLQRIAQVLEVSVEELIYGERSSTTTSPRTSRRGCPSARGWRWSFRM